MATTGLLDAPLDGKPIRPARGLYARRGKRLADLALASAALVVLAPLLAGVAVAVRLALGSPVLFRQERVGYRERVFRLLKFRTMTDARDAAGRLLPDGERLTPTGLLLRRWSLDELPQLVNVLRGDLSLVGPRPLLRRYLPRYTARQRQRHCCRPGITGWAQVHGRNRLAWEQRFEHDLWYLEHVGPWLDLRILLLTLRRLLVRDEVVAAAGQELEEFWGAAGPPPDGPRCLPTDESGDP
jgi:lipopolysaccharide/colanic/teichoic acid biosynthesis glycosyltransferase